MRVAFLYNEPAEDPAGIAEDSDPARSPIVAALSRNGHDVVSLSCTLDLDDIRRRLLRMRPDVVFNRVESLGGSDVLPAALMLLLDALDLPYTGCPTTPFLATSNKLTVKEQLQKAGLPTPEWLSMDSNLQNAPFPAKYILKSVYEHASFAMSDDSVVLAHGRDELVALIREAEDRWQKPYFAERFIDGREFNLALFGADPIVLPPAEIDFSAFPAGKPRIVGQRAKFTAGSFEFENTPRRYEFPASDLELIEQLNRLAVLSWRLFSLRGYARVDFRCDAESQPWILEVNANPCLSPDSGFAAALAEAGIGYDDGIERILMDALEGRRTRTSPREPDDALLTL
jgi:D-alanine-D-alanine ligase